MTLIFDTCRFLHNPKTGGTWVNEAVKRAGIKHEHLNGPQEHLDIYQAPCKDKPTISVVRNPLTFWQSFWAYRMKRGWKPNHPSELDQFASDRFTEFMARVVKHKPGWCSRRFEAYAGPPDCEISHVCRFEDLAAEVCRALKACGEDFEEWLVYSMPRQNWSDYRKFPAEYTPALRDDVIAAEWDAMKRFGYASQGLCV